MFCHLPFWSSIARLLKWKLNKRNTTKSYQELPNLLLRSFSVLLSINTRFCRIRVFCTNKARAAFVLHLHLWRWILNLLLRSHIYAKFWLTHGVMRYFWAILFTFESVLISSFVALLSAWWAMSVYRMEKSSNEAAAWWSIPQRSSIWRWNDRLRLCRYSSKG